MERVPELWVWRRGGTKVSLGNPTDASTFVLYQELLQHQTLDYRLARAGWVE